MIITTASAARIQQQARREMAEVEKRYDQTIEMEVFTEAEAPILDSEPETLLAGGPPPTRERKQSTLAKSPHAREDRARRLDVVLSEMIRDNPSIIDRAAQYVRRLLEQDPGSTRTDLPEWELILSNYSPERIRSFIISKSQRAQRLRQSSPFLPVLTQKERTFLNARLETP